MESSREMREPLARESTEASLVTEERYEVFLSGSGLPSPLAATIPPRTNDPLRSSVAKRSWRWWVRRLPTAARVRRRRPKRLSIQRGEVVVGTLAGINDSGQPLVRHPLDPSGRIMLARTTVPVSLEQVDREVVIAFESGDIERPIILGLLCRTDARTSVEPTAPQPTISQPMLQATVDGDRLVLTAQKEIVIQCGEASITLTRAGKVLLRGTYLLSQSSGVNRIRGGSVLIN
jgi:hypothetical protein